MITIFESLFSKNLFVDHPLLQNKKIKRNYVQYLWLVISILRSVCLLKLLDIMSYFIFILFYYTNANDKTLNHFYFLILIDIDHPWLSFLQYIWKHTSLTSTDIFKVTLNFEYCNWLYTSYCGLVLWVWFVSCIIP